MKKIQFYLDHRSYEQIKLGAVVFNNVYGYLGKTKDAKEPVFLYIVEVENGVRVQ